MVQIKTKLAQQVLYRNTNQQPKCCYRSHIRVSPLCVQIGRFVETTINIIYFTGHNKSSTNINIQLSLSPLLTIFSQFNTVKCLLPEDPLHQYSSISYCVFNIVTFRRISPSQFHTRWRLHSWLRNCATSWKVAGLIPDGVTGIFH